MCQEMVSLGLLWSAPEEEWKELLILSLCKGHWYVLALPPERAWNWTVSQYHPFVPGRGSNIKDSDTGGHEGSSPRSPFSWGPLKGQRCHSRECGPCITVSPQLGHTSPRKAPQKSAPLLWKYLYRCANGTGHQDFIPSNSSLSQPGSWCIGREKPQLAQKYWSSSPCLPVVVTHEGQAKFWCTWYYSH